MNINVISFLKFKQNEVHALADLYEPEKGMVSVFFDYAKRSIKKDKKGNPLHDSMVEYLEASIPNHMKLLIKKIDKHASFLTEFYFDNYDVSEEVEVGGVDSYYYMVNSMSRLNVIPVIGIDRSDAHNRSVKGLVNDGVISTKVICLRVNVSDFSELGEYIEEIEDELSEVIELFESVDLVLDCRVLASQDLKKIALTGNQFINSCNSRFNLRRVIVSGSSIPESAAMIVDTNSEKEIPRKEIDLIKLFSSNYDMDAELYLGDYGVVSPDYSDMDEIEPNQFQSRTAPKLVYPFKQHFLVKRAGSVKQNGLIQYRALFSDLIVRDYYRGPDFSKGDLTINNRASNLGPNVIPSEAVRIYVNAHISYMLKSDWANG